MSKCLKSFTATLHIIRDLEPITQEETPWSHGLRIVPSEDRGLACQRAGVRNRRLAKVTSSPALACICFYLPTVWEHLSGRNQVHCTTHSCCDEKSFIWTTQTNKNTIHKEGSTDSARKASTRSKQGTL